MTSAGFLGRPALATPAIPLDHLTAGFSVAAPGGRLLAAGSALDTTAPHPLGFLVLVGVARSGVAAVRSAELSAAGAARSSWPSWSGSSCWRRR